MLGKPGEARKKEKEESQSCTGVGIGSGRRLFCRGEEDGEITKVVVTCIACIQHLRLGISCFRVPQVRTLQTSSVYLLVSKI